MGVRSIHPLVSLSLIPASLAILAGVAWAAVQWMGTSVVYDPQNQVKSAKLQYHDRTHTLSLLPWGTWMGRAISDGTLIIQCHDGTVLYAGYVSPHVSTEVTVTGACELASQG